MKHYIYINRLLALYLDLFVFVFLRASPVSRVHRVRQVLLDLKVLLASLDLKDCGESLAQ